ncbi:hypothetical protein AM469_003575 [Pseudomonas aeruginosa]|nr:hypothetical protein AM469_003575 [Pseudomonas aeruginosa]
MNQTVAIPAAQDLPDAPRQPRIPDSPFASFDVRIASEHDAPRLSLLLQQLGSADPRPDPALLAIQLQRPRGDRVTLVAERGERLLGTCTLHLIEHLAHDFARSAILEDMVVDRHARGQGVGRELIGRAVERAQLGLLQTGAFQPPGPGNRAALLCRARVHQPRRKPGAASGLTSSCILQPVKCPSVQSACERVSGTYILH